MGGWVWFLLPYYRITVYIKLIPQILNAVLPNCPIADLPNYRICSLTFDFFMGGWRSFTATLSVLPINLIPQIITAVLPDFQMPNCRITEFVFLFYIFYGGVGGFLLSSYRIAAFINLIPQIITAVLLDYRMPNCRIAKLKGIILKSPGGRGGLFFLARLDFDTDWTFEFWSFWLYCR